MGTCMFSNVGSNSALLNTVLCSNVAGGETYHALLLPSDAAPFDVISCGRFRKRLEGGRRYKILPVGSVRDQHSLQCCAYLISHTERLEKIE